MNDTYASTAASELGYDVFMLLGLAVAILMWPDFDSVK
jgi:hypothetical protein